MGKVTPVVTFPIVLTLRTDFASKSALTNFASNTADSAIIWTPKEDNPGDAAQMTQQNPLTARASKSIF